MTSNRHNLWGHVSGLEQCMVSRLYLTVQSWVMLCPMSPTQNGKAKQRTAASCFAF